MKNRLERKNFVEEGMEEVKAANGVVYLRFRSLFETGLVKHGFSTRIGGVSRGVYASMNFSFSRSDCREDVEEDYRRMAEALEVDENSFALSCQVHGIEIQKIGKEDCGLKKERRFQEADGLVTNEKGITLVTFFADCIPLFILDTKNKAIGLAHSGWRGTLQNMAGEMLKRMEKEYGSRPSELLCGIGPGICRDCYVVGEEVYRLFSEKKDASYCESVFFRDEKGRLHLDLWEANRRNFSEAQVASENIFISDICTFENGERLFSHRKAGENRGNLAAFFALKG